MITNRITAAFGAAVLGLGLALAVAAPSHAHDALVDTDPAPDEVVATAPEQLTLTFSGELMELGRLVVVLDSDGEDWVAGESSIAATQLVQPLEPGMPDGSYQVRWQVVSQDGHPISGYFDFAVGEPTAGGIAAPGQDPEEAPPVGAEDAAFDPTPVIAISAIGVVVLAVIALLWARRRKHQE